MNIEKYLTESTPRTREFRRNVRWNAQTFTRTVGLVILMLVMAVSLTGVAALEQANDEPISLPDYIMQCYDGKGFADYPGGTSTLDSTLDAVELLMDDTDRKDWSVSLMFALDDIVARYAAMQSVYRGGFVSEGNTDPDVMTTALILETLKALGCLDDEHIDMERVQAYVGSSSNGLTSDVGLEFNRWPYQGVFEWTYGLIRAAVALDDPRLVGLRSVNLAKNVFAPDRNPADVVESIPFMKWGQQTFAASDRFGGGFINEDYERQLQIVECLDLLVEREVEGPTVMDLMFNTRVFAEKVVSRYDRDTKRFRTSDGDLSLRATADAFDVLERVGRLDVLFSGGMAAVDLVDFVRTVDSEVESWHEECAEGQSSLSERRSLAIVDGVLDDAVDVEVVRFAPVFRESELDTGVAEWERTSAPVADIPEVLWERAPVPEAQNDMSTTFAYLPYAVIMLVGIIASVCGKKKIAFLSILCIALFFFQQMYGDMVVTQTAGLITSLLPSHETPFPDMCQFVTAWVDTSPKRPVVDQVFPLSKASYNENEVSRKGGRPGQMAIECRAWSKDAAIDEVWVSYVWMNGAAEDRVCMESYAVDDQQRELWRAWIDIEWTDGHQASKSLNYTIHAMDTQGRLTPVSHTGIVLSQGVPQGPVADFSPAWWNPFRRSIDPTNDINMLPKLSTMEIDPDYKLDINNLDAFSSLIQDVVLEGLAADNVELDLDDINRIIGDIDTLMTNNLEDLEIDSATKVKVAKEVKADYQSFMKTGRFSKLRAILSVIEVVLMTFGHDLAAALRLVSTTVDVIGYDTNGLPVNVVRVTLKHLDAKSLAGLADTLQTADLHGDFVDICVVPDGAIRGVVDPIVEQRAALEGIDPAQALAQFDGRRRASVIAIHIMKLLLSSLSKKHLGRVIALDLGKDIMKGLGMDIYTLGGLLRVFSMEMLEVANKPFASEQKSSLVDVMVQWAFNEWLSELPYKNRGPGGIEQLEVASEIETNPERGNERYSIGLVTLVDRFVDTPIVAGGFFGMKGIDGSSIDVTEGVRRVMTWAAKNTGIQFHSSQYLVDVYPAIAGLATRSKMSKGQHWMIVGYSERLVNVVARKKWMLCITVTVDNHLIHANAGRDGQFRGFEVVGSEGTREIPPTLCMSVESDGGGNGRIADVVSLSADYHRYLGGKVNLDGDTVELLDSSIVPLQEIVENTYGVLETSTTSG